MGNDIISQLHNFIKKLKDQRFKEKNFKFGEDWENEVRESFFISEFYELLEKTHNYDQNRIDYVKSSMNPDFKFRCKYAKQEFFVECKAKDITKLLKKTKEYLNEVERLSGINQAECSEYEKSHKYLQLFDLSSKDQFTRFKEINTKTKVIYMVLLTSDHSIRDDVISLIPIDEMLSHQVYFSQLLQYQIPAVEVEPRSLWRNFMLFYGYKAYCIRCGGKTKFNNLNPFCYTCWKEWYLKNKFNNEENFCHACGRSHKTTSIKPLCLDCFKKFPINYAL
jgi:hypothetical protein